MPSLNEVTLVGHLGREPELRHANTGTAVANFSLATNERGKDGVDTTEWHRIVCWGKTAENCAQYLGKGSLVMVKGSLRTRKWEDKDGNPRQTTEINAWRVLFLSRQDAGTSSPHVGDAMTAGSMDDAMDIYRTKQAEDQPEQDDCPF